MPDDPDKAIAAFVGFDEDVSCPYQRDDDEAEVGFNRVYGWHP